MNYTSCPQQLDITKDFGKTSINEPIFFPYPVYFESQVIFAAQTRFTTSPNTPENANSRHFKILSLLGWNASPCLLTGRVDQNMRSYVTTMLTHYFPHLDQIQEMTNIVHSWITVTTFQEIERYMLSNTTSNKKELHLSMICNSIHLWQFRHDQDNSTVTKRINEMYTDDVGMKYDEELCRISIGQINCLHSCISNFLFSEMLRDEKWIDYIVLKLLQIIFVHKKELQLLL